jgi:hypothetical protein
MLARHTTDFAHNGPFFQSLEYMLGHSAQRRFQICHKSGYGGCVHDSSQDNYRNGELKSKLMIFVDISFSGSGWHLAIRCAATRDELARAHPSELNQQIILLDSLI